MKIHIYFNDAWSEEARQAAATARRLAAKAPSGSDPKSRSEEESKKLHGHVTQEEHKKIGEVGSAHRTRMAPSDFLLPAERKYPVKINGKYDRNLLIAAAREARAHGHEDLANKADNIRKKEFGK